MSPCTQIVFSRDAQNIVDIIDVQADTQDFQKVFSRGDRLKFEFVEFICISIQPDRSGSPDRSIAIFDLITGFDYSTLSMPFFCNWVRRQYASYDAKERGHDGKNSHLWSELKGVLPGHLKTPSDLRCHVKNARLYDTYRLVTEIESLNDRFTHLFKGIKTSLKKIIQEK